VGKNNTLQYGLTLLVICLIAASLLAVVNAMTKPKIEEQRLRVEQAALVDVFPSAAGFEPVREGADIIYYKALGTDKKIFGYVFKATRRGYSSDLVTMVGMRPDATIERIKILSQNETPGLGTRVTEILQKETLGDVVLRHAKAGETPRPWFQVQFDGKKATDLKGSVDTITGATITSGTIIRSVEDEAKKVLEKVNHGG
jgi:electron transport complex protein RnfG